MIIECDCHPGFQQIAYVDTLGMDRRSDYHSGDVRRGRGYVFCIDCRSRSRRTGARPVSPT